MNVKRGAKPDDLQDTADGSMVSTSQMQLDVTLGSGLTSGDETSQSRHPEEGDLAEVNHEVHWAFVDVTAQAVVQQRCGQQVQFARDPHHPYTRHRLFDHKTD